VVYVRDPLFLLPISRARHTLCAEVHNVPERGHVFFSLLDRAHRIVVISNGLRSVLTQNGIDPAKIFVVPDGVDADEFEIDVSREKAREMVGLPVGARIVLYTGHLYEWKGAGTFARAAALLPEALFVCVGGIEPEFSAFRDGHASVLNLKIIPFQHHSRIPLYLRAADVLVLPNSGRETISARYTSPLKLFEYMASGTPIVASDLPSMREILNERNSFFAIADDPKSFSAAIRVVLLDDTAGNRAKVAQKQARTYDWDARARRIMDSLRLLRHV
jgi:glycosyltransferase involved in cell wall biosynthesis